MQGIRIENVDLKQLSDFANTLRPDTEAIDSRFDYLASQFLHFQSRGLHCLGGSRFPLPGHQFCDSLATLSAVSGAFAFLALQQIVANFSLNVPDNSTWPLCGVAFGHLRNLDGSSPVWDGKTVTGRVPWLTGAGIFPQVILGVRTTSGEEVLALADAIHRPDFFHSEPMQLVACTGTNTVSVRIEGMPLSDDRVLAVRPPGSQQDGDASGVLYQTPLMVGSIRAALLLIQDSPTLPYAQKKRATDTAESR